jgi:ribosomal protein S18 acetylase RimI-like enzyme
MSLAFEIRAARNTDVGSITSCVCEAYLPHIERIGKQPGPMLADYAEAVARHDVRVAVEEGRVQGVIVLVHSDDAFWLENIAVRPEYAGIGLGRDMLDLAVRSAREGRYTAIHLYTNELMIENRAWYERRGFVETRRAMLDGYARVYYRKAVTR